MLTEREETKRAPTKPVEVSYVNADGHLDTNGYWFNFPNRWGSHPSMGKAIGLRRLEYTPCMASFNAYLSVKAEKTDDTYDWTENVVITKFYTSSNTLDEILANLNEFLDDCLDSVVTDVEDFKNNTIIFNVAYDGSNVTISCKDATDDDNIIPLEFKLTFETLNDNNSFLKIFNQNEVSVITALTSTSEGTLTFSNVWNRNDLYFHASFSDATRQIIGRNFDFWPEPSVYYAASLNSDRFIIKYSQDTSTYITPRHGTLFMQFSLVFNYNRDA